MQRYRGRILAKYGRILSVEESPATRCGRQIGIWRADFHRTLAPRIYEGGARRARGVPHPDAEKFLFEAVCPDFGLKQLPGWVGSSPPSVRTGVLRIMVRLPPAIVYYRFAARSTTPRKRGKQGLRPVSLPNSNLSLCFRRWKTERRGRGEKKSAMNAQLCAIKAYKKSWRNL